MKYLPILLSPDFDVFRLVDKIRISNSGCWIWTGADNGRGYGRIKVSGRAYQAHRVSYAAFVDPPDGNLDLDHRCKVTLCINPDHLEPVTHVENVLRGYAGQHLARKIRCPKGHEYPPYIPGGARPCKTCVRDGARDAYRRKNGWSEDEVRQGHRNGKAAYTFKT